MTVASTAWKLAKVGGTGVLAVGLVGIFTAPAGASVATTLLMGTETSAQALAWGAGGIAEGVQYASGGLEQIAGSAGGAELAGGGAPVTVPDATGTIFQPQ